MSVTDDKGTDLVFFFFKLYTDSISQVPSDFYEFLLLIGWLKPLMLGLDIYNLALGYL